MTAIQTPARSSASGKTAKAAKPSQQKEAILARWDGRAKTDQRVREYFLNCDKAKGLMALQDMRRHVEIASRAYDENIQRNMGEVCANPKCNRRLGPNQPWYNRMVVKDPATQQNRNVFTCSLACYVAVWGKSGTPQDQRG